MNNTSFLSQQVNNSIHQLHALFDEIGVASHERESREAELFNALSEALENQVRIVTAEKKEMVDEARRTMTCIRQMEASLDSSRPRRSHDQDDEFQITYPLNRCLQALKEKSSQVGRLHRERCEQVLKLVEALESYSSHLEPGFVRMTLPPTGPNQSIPPTFDLSPAYVDGLDGEFTRVYDEYTRRIATVQSLSDDIIQLWAELGIPQAQQDGAIVQFSRDAPEQLGLHDEDLARLQTKRDRLADEKKNRERRLRDLRAAVENLWDKLGVEAAETKTFLNQNRGCGVRQINEFEDELARLHELKRQNLHLFVEDARVKLQDLWDALYLSEDEMLDFTPAFSDVYSDALLEAHEREVSRLEALKEQRAPTLALIERHRTLISDRDELAASSQDASRLMMRGQKGEKRDPGKLLREEKMRKRIAKELPKVTAEARRMLEQWEDEYGKPFLVFGERYLDELEAEAPKPAAAAAAAAAGTRSKTPAGPPPSHANANPSRAGGHSRANSTKSASAKAPTTVGHGTLTKNSLVALGKGSPSKIPARMPLSNMKNGNNSPERPRVESRAASRAASRAESRAESRTAMHRTGAPLRAPPPKMRDLEAVPELAPTPAKKQKQCMADDDVYDDGATRTTRSNSNQSYRTQASGYGEQRPCDGRYDVVEVGGSRGFQGYAPAPGSRQISNTSTVVSGGTTVVSAGSENWETYEDASEPEPDASEEYYARVRAARGKRFEPEQCPRPGSQAKRARGVPPPPGYAGPVMIEPDGQRIISGSEWTDEEVF
ncbi:hypothetical protein RJ55_01154 [Drechmeria coniospora]|nr:hypothetical protein RJ55_01154 [Drechmeria coniospora]